MKNSVLVNSKSDEITDKSIETPAVPPLINVFSVVLEVELKKGIATECQYYFSRDRSKSLPTSSN